MFQTKCTPSSSCLRLFLLIYGLHLAAAAGDDDRFLYSGFTGANLTLHGMAKILPGGLLRLTNGTVQQTGHAFHPRPLRLRRAPNGTEKAVRSFSSSFVFGIQTKAIPGLGGHGIVLVVVPDATNFSSVLPASYMGLFNRGSNGLRSNLFAVELDTIQNQDFDDKDNNHVGININSLASRNSTAAGYYDDKSGQFHELTLISGKAMQVWVNYDGDTTQINVTLAPLGMNKPIRPLISARLDLSTVITNQSCIGFSSSTGTLSTHHYVLGWSFAADAPAPAIDMAKLPKLPSKRSDSKVKIVAIALPVVLVVLVLVVVACIVLRRCRYRHEELREDWEGEFGPHRISYRDLFEATERFKNKNLLGVGGFGGVYKGVLPSSNLEVAVKRVSHDSRQGLKEFVAEVATIGRLRHRNIVQLLGYCRLKDELLLVYEYMPNGSLDNYLYAHDGKPALDWSQRFQIIKGVAAGLLYLHEEWEQVVVHRDIKASNVLLDGEMNARLGDFGLAKLYNHGAELQTCTVVAGTLGYLAPELSRTGKASPATDVFAFGAFLLEVTSGRRPVEQNSWGDRLMLVDRVFEHWRRGSLAEAVDPRLEGDHDAGEASLVLKLGLLCSHPSPNTRPSMRQVMQYLHGHLPLPQLKPSQMVSFSVLSMTTQRGGFDDSCAMSRSASMRSIGTPINFSSG